MRRHSGVEMSTESDRSAVFDGAFGGDCRFFFCLAITKPPSLPGCLPRYAFADMTVCMLGSTCRRFEGPWCLVTQEEAVQKYYRNISNRLTNLR